MLSLTVSWPQEGAAQPLAKRSNSTWRATTFCDCDLLPMLTRLLRRPAAPRWLDCRPAQRSGGQRQRVAIGRAIEREPDAFLFDEPLSNLDAALRGDMRIELARLHNDLGATMIYVTHDQIEAMTLADKIVVLDGGVVQQVGSPLELYNNPANLFVAGFIGSPKMNLLGLVARPEGNASSAGLSAALGLNRGAWAGASLTLGLRPHDLRVASNGPLNGQVRLVERLGNETILRVSLADTTEITAVLPGQDEFAIGQTVAFDFKPSIALLFDENGRRLPSPG